MRSPSPRKRLSPPLSTRSSSTPAPLERGLEDGCEPVPAKERAREVVFLQISVGFRRRASTSRKPTRMRRARRRAAACCRTSRSWSAGSVRALGRNGWAVRQTHLSEARQGHRSTRCCTPPDPYVRRSPPCARAQLGATFTLTRRAPSRTVAPRPTSLQPGPHLALPTHDQHIRFPRLVRRLADDAPSSRLPRTTGT
jgi:hypothetical protein